MPLTRRNSGALLVILLSGVFAPRLNAQPHSCNGCSLTIFADGGRSSAAAASQGSSGQGSNLGHVFIELANGDKQVFLGYYGDPKNPSRGQLRVDADLFLNGYWDVKKTYDISEEGYNKAHEVIDGWGRNGQTWRPWCNCGDFAEAVATVAGINFGDLPKAAGLNTPALWVKYLRAHGGAMNPARASVDFDGQWQCAETGERITIGHSGNKYSTVFFGIHWTLVRSGQELTDSHKLTSAEISGLFNVPGNIAQQFVGAPAVLVLTLSNANDIAYATVAPRSIRRNPQTGKLGLTPGPPLSGTLVRLK